MGHGGAVIGGAQEAHARYGAQCTYPPVPPPVHPYCACFALFYEPMLYAQCSFLPALGNGWRHRGPCTGGMHRGHAQGACTGGLDGTRMRSRTISGMASCPPASLLSSWLRLQSSANSSTASTNRARRSRARQGRGGAGHGSVAQVQTTHTSIAHWGDTQAWHTGTKASPHPPSKPPSLSKHLVVGGHIYAFSFVSLHSLLQGLPKTAGWGGAGPAQDSRLGRGRACPRLQIASLA